MVLLSGPDRLPPDAQLVSECQVKLTMSSGEVAAMDAWLAEQRRRTGERCPRTEMIRRAIRFFMDCNP